MPQTPGAPALPAARREVRLLRDLFPDRAVVLEGPRSRRRAVLRALPDAPWAHFSCHSRSGLDSPSRSGLLLHDHDRAQLTVVDLSQLHLRDAELAYLSACATTRTTTALADEAIHLTSACQLAGYRNVIGTMWELGDRPALHVAAAVYGAVARSAAGAGAAPLALHTAVRTLREQVPAHPSAWAAHVHVGV
jgi:CHAT domain-containing protein